MSSIEAITAATDEALEGFAELVVSEVIGLRKKRGSFWRARLSCKVLALKLDGVFIETLWAGDPDRRVTLLEGLGETRQEALAELERLVHRITEAVIEHNDPVKRVRTLRTIRWDAAGERLVALKHDGS
ncbi:hypothetical protein [Streptosporangium sp. NPDC002524]|uniref:hypothetical protein n=1 Tax=Streptosporangium sp. NPDC002524 TaxID=3154537 RepID=UPI00332A943D